MKQQDLKEKAKVLEEKDIVNLIKIDIKDGIVNKKDNLNEKQQVNKNDEKKQEKPKENTVKKDQQQASKEEENENKKKEKEIKKIEKPIEKPEEKEPAKDASCSFLYIIIPVVILGISFLLFYKQKCITRLNVISGREFTDKILINSLRLASDEDRNEPIRLLFSGENIQEMEKVSKTIYKQLTSSCQRIKWNFVNLNDYPIQEWRKIIFEEIKSNPFSFFIMNIINERSYQYDFLKDIFDGENAIVNYEEEYVSPKNAIFIMLSNFGSDDFRIVSKSNNFFEIENSLKKIVKRTLRSKEWEDRLIHRLSRIVPFF